MSENEWEAVVAAHLERPVQVRYGRSRTRPLQFEEQNGGVRIRMHRFFRDAPAQIAQDVAAWIRAGRRARRACERLDRWIDERLAALPEASRPLKLHSFGAVHDLAPMAEAVFADELTADFQERRRPGVTWGRRARSSARRSLMLGSYQAAGHVVRVHPVLDQEFVPSWFVRFVLFHELLHAALPDEHHSARFRRRERGYRDYDAAQRWETKHIGRLIRSARKGVLPQPIRRQGFLFES